MTPPSAILHRRQGRIEVAGYPVNDAGDPRDMGDGERVCTSPDSGELIVFHVRADEYAEGYLCPDCGRTNSEVRA